MRLRIVNLNAFVTHPLPITKKVYVFRRLPNPIFINQMVHSFWIKTDPPVQPLKNIIHTLTKKSREHGNRKPLVNIVSN